MAFKTSVVINYTKLKSHRKTNSSIKLTKTFKFLNCPMGGICYSFVAEMRTDRSLPNEWVEGGLGQPETRNDGRKRRYRTF